MLHFAYRHHIAELILRAVVEIYWPTSTGPDVPIFKRFERAWATIDKTQYDIGLDDHLIFQSIKDERDNIVTFISNRFKVVLKMERLFLYEFNFSTNIVSHCNISGNSASR